MPRSGALRNFIRAYNESSQYEKLSFVPPFFIFVLELYLLIHAVSNHDDPIIINVTVILTAISILEIILISEELHQRHKENNYKEDLTIRLDDHILNSHYLGVKKIVENFIEQNPQYKDSYSEVYRLSCHIMATHRLEDTEKQIQKSIKLIIKKNPGSTLKYIVELYLKRHPDHEEHINKIYDITSRLLHERDAS